MVQNQTERKMLSSSDLQPTMLAIVTFVAGLQSLAPFLTQETMQEMIKCAFSALGLQVLVLHISFRSYTRVLLII